LFRLPPVLQYSILPPYNLLSQSVIFLSLLTVLLWLSFSSILSRSRLL
jgi:hypothetical protein